MRPIAIRSFVLAATVVVGCGSSATPLWDGVGGTAGGGGGDGGGSGGRGGGDGAECRRRQRRDRRLGRNGWRQHAAA